MNNKVVYSDRDGMDGCVLKACVKRPPTYFSQKITMEASNKSLWESALSNIERPPPEKSSFAPLAHARLCVTMVEFREHAWLRAVLWNAAHVYGGLPDVALVVVCGTGNLRFVQDALQGLCGATLKVLPRSNVTIPEYNALLTSKAFYELFDPCPAMLLIQTDTLSRKRVPWSCVEQYSYVGAPWGAPQNGGPPRGVVGNGGYSLRDVEAMKAACEAFAFDPVADKAEDLFFAKHGDGAVKKIAPAHVAAAFSVEHVPHPDPCGMHQAWRFHAPGALLAWLADLPGLGLGVSPPNPPTGGGQPPPQAPRARLL